MSASGGGVDAGVAIELLQRDGYRFEVHFDDAALPPLLTDEPAPLGAGAGPNPLRLLAAAVANCLAASLLFALRKFRNEPGPLHARATLATTRTEQRRLRVARIDVELRLGVPAAALAMRERALAQFEDYCVVTQSVRAAFPVDVRVVDVQGVVLHPPPERRAGAAAELAGGLQLCR